MQITWSEVSDVKVEWQGKKTELSQPLDSWTESTAMHGGCSQRKTKNPCEVPASAT